MEILGVGTVLVSVKVTDVVVPVKREKIQCLRKDYG